MKLISTILYILVSLINFYPVIGSISASALNSLYGVIPDDSNMLILMRHRAILFGIIGSIIIFAAFNVQLRPVATIIGLLSMISFIVLTFATPDFNAQLQRIAVIDIVASIVLVIAFLLGTNEQSVL